ncbi:hypothetical protein [Raoultella terrigena]|uniref:hypothetical protein n=1 Tax=Raoultella terrigena TaxID=577 RepID=UPI00349F7F7C
MLSKRDLNGAIFNTELNDFCRKYFIKSKIEPTKNEILAFPEKYNEIKTSLFESFILHNEINFKVEGENIPLCVLLNEIGLRGVEELVDDGALSFTLWSPMILHIVDNLEGINPLCAGRHNNGVYVDPEESISTGLGFMINPLKKGEARALTRKLRDLYLSVPKGIEQDCVNITMSALESGKLKKLGLNLKRKDKFTLNKEEKKLLTTCAADLLGYKYLIQKRALASPTSSIQILLNDSIEKTKFISKDEIFSAIVQLENIPDIRTSFYNMGLPMDELIKLRKHKSSKKFRKWISTLNQISNPLEAQKYYIDSIQATNSFFDTFWGKTTKSISMMILGACAGSCIDSKLGPLIGATGLQLANPLTDYVLDMADEYIFSELTKGWTPKLFISKLESLSFKYSI